MVVAGGSERRREPVASDAPVRAVEDFARDEAVAVLLAVEAGSRAWGTAGPDSDHDLLLIGRRQSGAYGLLTPPVDAISREIEGFGGVVFWDVRKCLSILVRGATRPAELLRSTIVHVECLPEPDGPGTGIASEIVAFAERWTAPKRAMASWLEDAKRASLRVLGPAEFAWRRYPHMLRPILCARRMRLGAMDIPPPGLADLAEEARAPDAVRAFCRDFPLLRLEDGPRQRQPALDVFYGEEREASQKFFADAPDPGDRSQAIADADALVLRWDRALRALESGLVPCRERVSPPAA